MNNRYLIDFNTEQMEKEQHDVIIIGSGIAGVYTALSLPENLNIVIVTKETLNISNSALAQGGIAVSLDKEDSPELHFKDTINAGAGLCNEGSVWVLVNEGEENIKRLCSMGVNFDTKVSGQLALTREGAHSMNRIIHAGDTTGKEVCDKLISVVKTKSNVEIKERTFAIDLLTENNECKGLLVYDEDLRKNKLFLSNIVICATGGFGQIYFNTTNPEVATGDGVALAFRAGAELMDMEFVQFHPTVLHHPLNKSFLISEAVRGEGAKLLDADGNRFMPEYHRLAELAPRDVVSRAIFDKMKKTGAEHVNLDITFKGEEYLINRFPNIYKTCMEYGIDISKDYIPVAPAEHYCMGGIKTDESGRTNIKGFYACGECACAGIHGANRLASNSLLEGLVFGNKISAEVAKLLKNYIKTDIKFNFDYKTERVNEDIQVNEIKTDLQKEINENVGIIRDKCGLETALFKVDSYIEKVFCYKTVNIDLYELKNMLQISRLVIDSALIREESRGAHFRADFSFTDNKLWNKNIVQKTGG